LIGRYCPHRRVDLAIGVAEQDGLRCQYHGWKFNHAGECAEQPFEDTTHLEDNFRARCGLPGYEVQEVAGLVFAYAGPKPAPAFPLWEPLVWDNVGRDIAITELPCNWLQCQENSLYPVHVEWLHGYFGKYVSELAGEPTFSISQRSLRHQKIGFDVFDYGIIKRRILEGQTEEDPEWKHGHPILFPHVPFVGSKFSATLQFRVPIDDTHTYHVSLYTYRALRARAYPCREHGGVVWAYLGPRTEPPELPDLEPNNLGERSAANAVLRDCKLPPGSRRRHRDQSLHLPALRSRRGTFGQNPAPSSTSSSSIGRHATR
jgi:5,5'-dehydrodivanillate O-demethylase